MTPNLKEIYKRADYGFQCASDGIWYSCGYGSKFVGCCAGEACTNGCSQGNLRNATFDKSKYGQFPDPECPNGSSFYSCTGTSPPFWGCCKENPCQLGGCPTGDLTAAVFGNNAVQSSAYSPTGGAQSSHHDSHVGAIAGGTVGGIAVIAIIVGILVYYFRRSASRKAQYNGVQSQDPNIAADGMTEKYGGFNALHSPNLPPYSSPPSAYPYYNPVTASDGDHNEHQTQYAELPSNSNRLSELSGDIRRVELESPVASPKNSPNPQARSPLKDSFTPDTPAPAITQHWQEIQPEAADSEVNRLRNKT